jgi:hypothetical protein
MYLRKAGGICAFEPARGRLTFFLVFESGGGICALRGIRGRKYHRFLIGIRGGVSAAARLPMRGDPSYAIRVTKTTEPHPMSVPHCKRMAERNGDQIPRRDSTLPGSSWSKLALRRKSANLRCWQARTAK